MSIIRMQSREGIEYIKQITENGREMQRICRPPEGIERDEMSRGNDAGIRGQ